MVVGGCGELIKLKRSRKEGGKIGEQVVKEEEVESGKSGAVEELRS